MRVNAAFAPSVVACGHEYKIRNIPDSHRLWSLVFCAACQLLDHGYFQPVGLGVVPPAEDYVFTAVLAAFITFVITLPVCMYIGLKIRENTSLSDELVRLVNRDRLTDVATRDFFFERMDKNPESYGVSLMVDIDHFKMVNDTYGHFAGDDVIKHVSQLLRKETRENDVICRFGGEEFVVFLHEVSGDQGQVRLLNACGCLCKPHLPCRTV